MARMACRRGGRRRYYTAFRAAKREVRRRRELPLREVRASIAPRSMATTSRSRGGGERHVPATADSAALVPERRDAAAHGGGADRHADERERSVVFTADRA